MSMVTNFQLKINNTIKIKFNGGDVSSYSGLFLIKEFAHKIRFDSLIETNDDADRSHKDDHNLLQKIFQIIAGYFADNDSDELINEPVLKAILGKEGFAS